MRIICFQQYDAQLIADDLALLSVDNVMMSLVADGFEATQSSPYYQTPYRVDALSPALLQRIRQAGNNDFIQLPEKNNLIAEDFYID